MVPPCTPSFRRQCICIHNAGSHGHTDATLQGRKPQHQERSLTGDLPGLLLAQTHTDAETMTNPPTTEAAGMPKR